MTALRAWLGERLPLRGEQLRAFTNEPVPNHMKRWWWALGGTPAYLFGVQVLTGILLAFQYQPSPKTAYESVRFITHEAAFGWYVRGLHKWAATLMIASVVLHQLRVFFTGAYRRPRELNWLLGMGLLLATLTAGFTGYSLVYEQLSYWGATVGANIAGSVPLVGPVLRRLMLGADQYDAHTLSRFFVLHGAITPAAIVVLFGMHVLLIRLHGVSELRFEGEPEGKKGHFDFWPDHVLSETIVALVLMILLTTLAIVFPATLGPRADPLSTPEIIKPEWFFYVAFRWLKLFSRNVAIAGMGAIVSLMIGWPFVDGWLRKRLPRAEPSVWIGATAVLAIVALTVWEGAVSH